VTPPNTFTGAALDRAGDRRRDEVWVAEQRANPAARAVVAGRDGVHVTGGEERRLALVPLEQAGDGEPLLLGLDDAGPIFAAEGDGSRLSLLGLREAAAALPQAEGGLAAYAAALLGWHRRHRFCANCGAPTEIREAGHVRRCPDCGAEHHPRTDPVVIMLVLRGDEVLLGRQASWPRDRYSALAGFVEPGESLEEAVAREVLEESGVRIGPPRYVSSQPWPFPASLMLGFVAPWDSGEPRIGDEELEDVRWFSRKAVEDAVRERGPLRLPPPLAIARQLIDGWLES
jgi:NAD+ diphosphatase